VEGVFFIFSDLKKAFVAEKFACFGNFEPGFGVSRIDGTTTVRRINDRKRRPLGDSFGNALHPTADQHDFRTRIRHLREALGQFIHRNIARFAPLMWHVEKNALHMCGDQAVVVAVRIDHNFFITPGRQCIQAIFEFAAVVGFQNGGLVAEGALAKGLIITLPHPIFEDDSQSFGILGWGEQEEEEDEQTHDDTKIPEMLTHPYR